MMKVVLSYLAPEQQNGLAVYIKFSELQYALRLLQNTPRQPIIRGYRTILSPQSLLDGSFLQRDNSDILELLDELMPFGGPQERARLQNIRNLLTSISQMRQMMDMMEMMRELFPEGMGSGDSGDFSSFASMFSDMAGMNDMTGMSGSSDGTSGMTGMDPTVILQMLQMLQSAQSSGADKSEET